MQSGPEPLVAQPESGGLSRRVPGSAEPAAQEAVAEPRPEGQERRPEAGLLLPPAGTRDAMYPIRQGAMGSAVFPPAHAAPPPASSGGPVPQPASPVGTGRSFANSDARWRTHDSQAA